MNDYCKSLQIDSSVLAAEETQMVNDWAQKHRQGEGTISLHSAETQAEFNAFCVYPIPVFRSIETFLKAVEKQRVSDSEHSVKRTLKGNGKSWECRMI